MAAFRAWGAGAGIAGVAAMGAILAHAAVPTPSMPQQIEDNAVVVTYPTSPDAASFWTTQALTYADSDRDLHGELVDATLSSLSAWFSDAPNGEAAETEGGALPQMGLLMARFGDDARLVCSASVVASPTKDRLLTAAHCLDGVTADLVFVPDYHDGEAPYGVWHVEAAAIDADYGHSPAGDQAVLKVASREGQMIEDVVGALDLAYDTPPAPDVVMAGYPYQTGEPRLCRAEAMRYVEAGSDFFAMHCASMPAGVSGGPWLVATDDTVTLVGITGGGQDGGGYTADDSVATPVTTATTRPLIERPLGA